MARIDLRHPANAPGEWFVDTRCIDCGTCRDVAPEIFDDAATGAVVARQPSPGQTVDAWLAAQACPTASIGTRSRLPRPGRLYPREVEPGSDVWDLGYCAEDSYGASAWLVVRPDGNVMIDSPRFTEALVKPIAARGGIHHIALTHRDDVADASRWAECFGARVWIHEDDRSAAAFATDLVHGVDERSISPGFVAIPTPGHTKGSTCFLLEEQYLFTGDSLAWSHRGADLHAFRSACWWSWTAQADSLERLASHRFAWVLPGHGGRCSGDPGVLHDRLVALVARMRGA